MCGIFFCKVLDATGCGSVDFHELFSLSLREMKYRGRDNVTVKEVGGVYFGHCRLSINGLGESFNQPMASGDSTLIFNGEYYNYKEKYSYMKSDTQALFEHLLSDPDGHALVNGPYAYAWHDKKSDTTVFRRDVFGEKPLYYYSDAKVFLVSSTLKAIVFFIKGLGGSVELNVDALRFDYALHGFVREPETVWKDIFELPPNHTLVLRGNKFSLKKEVLSLPGSRREKAESYFSYSLLSRDVDAALLLSSGVDSSYLLVKSLEAGAGLALVTYGSQDGDDEVGEVEKNLSTINFEEKGCSYSALLQSGGGLEKLGEELVFYASMMEQPTSDGLQVNRVLRHLKAEFPDLKVVYTGLGGDEIFGGYPSFKNFKIINFLINVPRSYIFIPKMRRFVDGKKMLGEWGGLTYYFLYRADPEYVVEKNQSLLTAAYERFKKGVNDALPLGYFERYKSRVDMQIKFLETFDYCKNQLLRDVDNISMYYGLEARVPLLNPYLLDFPVDGKEGLKQYVHTRAKITFGKKRGFSVLDDNCVSVYKEVLVRNNGVLDRVFGEEMCGRWDTLDTGALRKFSIVAEWLRHNVSDGEEGRGVLVAK